MLEKKSREYSTKVVSGTATTSILHSLAWNVDELQRLIEAGRKSHVEIQVLSELVEEDVDFVRANVPRKVTQLKAVLMNIVRGVYLYR